MLLQVIVSGAVARKGVISLPICSDLEGRRLAVARYRMICLLLLNEQLNTRVAWLTHNIYLKKKNSREKNLNLLSVALAILPSVFCAAVVRIASRLH